MWHFLSQLVPQEIKNLFWHFPQAVLANIFYRFPGRGLVVIGVTGTNGKTTTTKLIAAILAESGKKVAYASTIEYSIAGTVEVNASKFTTSSAWQLQRFLVRAKKAGCTHVVLEISSHALDQKREWGVSYQIAVITNVTREHLDYHETMEKYRQAKAQLFKRVKVAVVNRDMEKPEEFFAASPNQTVTYSTKYPEAEVFASDIEIDFAKTHFRALGTVFELKLTGLFNVENTLAAIGVGKALGISSAVMTIALAKVPGIPGRMESVSNDHGVDILIDYAVTPDAFEQLYKTILPLKIPATKIIHVFGACGDRDRGKRPMMGEIASKNADIIILTNEDPYYEDPERIIDEIERGVTKKRDKDYFRVFDRRSAIEKAFSLAERGDIVLVTGKGAEETMAIGNKRISWNERKVIEELLCKNKKSGD